ncbi:MAG: sodium:solute symporter family protein [Bryobacter sp.]|nr:sodium:solute symporter family protein [Bryobacter sp.]
MQLTTLDWLFIVVYFVITIGIGLYYRARASQNVDEFFLSGRNIPWWLAGTSMVATTFAADTPLAVTGLVFKGGIAGNWLWWNMVASGMMTVFLYARLWRRSGVMTDIEFSEIRYSGKPAAFLRGFRAVYLGIPINCIVVGWVNLAMVKILELVLGVDKLTALAIVMGLIALTSLISTLSGLWGVLVTDAFQFVIMMAMTLVLAFAAVSAAGGMEGLLGKLRSIDALRGVAPGDPGSVLGFVPDLNSTWMPMITFGVYIGMTWWSTWYPGAEPGGGGYVAQRMFCAKDEKHSLLATLWFQIAHYAIRPWPWILTALSAMVLYPNLNDPETGYVRVLVDHLPPMFRGVMLASFIAAYMSTIATQLNWGASYLVNDVYRRFIRPEAAQEELVRVGQLSTIFITLVSAVVTYNMDSITGAWKLLIVTGAGTGLVLLLRWYWWRINAWSEVAAMTVAAIVSIYLQTSAGMDSEKPEDFAWIMIYTVSLTTLAWVVTTFLTKPEPWPVLEEFYRRTRPSRGGWGPVAARIPEVKADGELTSNLICWLVGCVLIYSALFGVGKLILGSPWVGIRFLVLAAASGWYLYRTLARRGWSSISE